VQTASKSRKASAGSELASRPKQTAVKKTTLPINKKTEAAKVTETFKQKVLLSSKATHQSIDLKNKYFPEEPEFKSEGLEAYKAYKAQKAQRSSNQNINIHSETQQGTGGNDQYESTFRTTNSKSRNHIAPGTQSVVNIVISNENSL
jgi:CRISPR/Cas system endoribonuclease Cas6 (RAMP superfamily)